MKEQASHREKQFFSLRQQVFRQEKQVFSQEQRWFRQKKRAFLSERQGKGGVLYGPRHAVCLETQHFPDAIHHPEFPSPVLQAGEVYRQRTVYRFSRC